MDTRTVKTVRIFLASSNELHDDRVAFADFIERLQNHYETRNYTFLLKKWEYLDSAYNDERKQNEYNKVIQQCDYFVTLFHTRAGKYTLEEFDVALKECHSRKLPLFIYFKEIVKVRFPKSLFSQKKESKELTDFKTRILTKKIEHFWGVYANNDKLHLDFVLWLDSYLFGGKSELKAENGTVTLGNVKVAEMSQLSFAANNVEYQRLSEEIKTVENEIQQIRRDIEKYPNDDEFGKRLSEKEIKRERLVKKFESQQDALLSTAKLIAEFQRQQVSEKLQQAIDAFEAGQLDEANRLLDDLQKTGDQLAEEINTKHEQLHEHIEALRLQAKTVMADVKIPIEERIAHVAKIYAKAEDWASRSAYDKKKYEKLLFDYAGFLDDYAHYEEAVKIYQRQIAFSEELYGKDSEDTAISYNNIGLVYMNQGDYDKALDFYFKALDIDEKVLGEEHPDTATDYNNIAGVYYSKGDYDKALEYFFKALGIVRKVLGEMHPYSASTYNNIGSIFDDKGDYDKALEYHFKALDIREKVLGKEHPDTAISYNNIGLIYDDKGEYDKALEYHFKALDIHEKVLGKEHPSTATSYNNIGLVYDDKGDYDKALEYHLKALDIREKVLGKEHPSTATSYNNIAGVYYSTGDYDKALEYYEKALLIDEKVLGKEHPDTAIDYNNIGLVYKRQGDYDKALEYYEKALAIFLIVLGPDHPSTKTVQRNIDLLKLMK